jgi:hypothetical protein
MKSGLCAGGLNDDGSKSLGKMAWHEVRESGERSSSPATSLMGMWEGRGGGSQGECG